MSNKIINCEIHDYIEIACTFGYEVKLELLNGDTIQGKAITTQTSKYKKEYLILKGHVQNQRVELINIKCMEAIHANPHFDLIKFN